MITIAKAIKAINPSAEYQYQEEDFSTIEWMNGTSPISQSDVETKQAELQAEYDAKQYQRDRNPNEVAKFKGATNFYPSIGDQLDMIYHDQVDGTTTFKDAIQVVKDAHPKP